MFLICFSLRSTLSFSLALLVFYFQIIFSKNFTVKTACILLLLAPVFSRGCKVNTFYFPLQIFPFLFALFLKAGAKVNSFFYLTSFFKTFFKFFLAFLNIHMVRIKKPRNKSGAL